MGRKRGAAKAFGPAVGARWGPEQQGGTFPRGGGGEGVVAVVLCSVGVATVLCAVCSALVCAYLWWGFSAGLPAARYLARPWIRIFVYSCLPLAWSVRLAQKDLKWTITICTHFFHQRGKQPRFLVFQKILRTSHDFAQNHVGGALFDVSKVGLSTLKIKRMRVFQPWAKNPDQRESSSRCISYHLGMLA
jgi:hypothetical protein